MLHTHHIPSKSNYQSPVALPDAFADVSLNIVLRVVSSPITKKTLGDAALGNTNFEKKVAEELSRWTSGESITFKAIERGVEYNYELLDVDRYGKKAVEIRRTPCVRGAQTEKHYAAGVSLADLQEYVCGETVSKARAGDTDALFQLMNLANNKYKPALYQLGLIYLDQGDHKSGFLCITTAAELGYAEAKDLNEIANKAKAEDCGALLQLMSLANNGYGPALYELGQYYRQIGEQESALICFTRAEELGHHQAKHQCQQIRDNVLVGIFKKAQSGKLTALQELKDQADTKGNAIAQRLMGQLYKEGAGVGRDNELAFYYFHKSAEQGDSEAMVQCGLMYERGIGCEQNADKALALFKSAAAQEHPWAKLYFNLVEMGVNVLESIKAAPHERLSFLTKDWNWGLGGRRSGPSDDVCNSMQRQYDEIMNQKLSSVHVSFVAEWLEHCESYKLFNDIKKLADQGLAPAQFQYAMMCCDDNPDEALHYLEKATDQGYAPAQYQCGMFALRRGDLESADQYFNAAADQGYAPAQFQCGMFALRRGDLENAAKYFQWAADQGHAEAQYKVGVKMLNDGLRDKALHYLKLATDRTFQGERSGWPRLNQHLEFNPKKVNPSAQFQLALMLEKEDPVKAFNYLNAATEQNYVPAQCRLAMLLSEFEKTPEKSEFEKTPEKFDDQMRAKLKKILTKCQLAGEDGGRTNKIVAQFQLGLMAFINNKPDQALQYFRAAASQGHAPAQYQLWMMLRKTTHHTEAMDWLKKAVQQKDPAALSASAAVSLSINEHIENTSLSFVPPELRQTIAEYNSPDIWRDFSTLTWFETNIWDVDQSSDPTWFDNLVASTCWDKQHVNWFDVMIELISWDTHGFKPDETFLAPS